MEQRTAKHVSLSLGVAASTNHFVVNMLIAPYYECWWERVSCCCCSPCCLFSSTPTAGSLEDNFWQTTTGQQSVWPCKTLYTLISSQFLERLFISTLAFRKSVPSCQTERTGWFQDFTLEWKLYSCDIWLQGKLSTFLVKLPHPTLPFSQILCLWLDRRCCPNYV